MDTLPVQQKIIISRLSSIVQYIAGRVQRNNWCIHHSKTHTHSLSLSPFLWFKNRITCIKYKINTHIHYSSGQVYVHASTVSVKKTFELYLLLTFCSLFFSHEYMLNWTFAFFRFLTQLISFCNLSFFIHLICIMDIIFSNMNINFQKKKHQRRMMNIKKHIAILI